MSFATELGRVLKQAAVKPERSATPQPRTVLQDATPAQVSTQQRGERQALARRFAPMLFESSPQGGQRLRRGAGYAISHDPSGGMSRGVALAPAESRANDLNYADQARSLARQPQQGMSDYAWRTAPHRQPSQVDPARQQVRNRTTAFGGQAMRDWRRPVSMSSEEMAQARESGSEFTPGRERFARNVGNINLARVNPSWMQRLWPAQVEGPAAYRQSYPGVSTTPQQAPSGLRRFVQPAVSWWNRNFRDQQPVQFAGT